MDRSESTHTLFTSTFYCSEILSHDLNLTRWGKGGLDAWTTCMHAQKKNKMDLENIRHCCCYRCVNLFVDFP